MADPIPPAFHSVEHDSPFSSCCRCERPLDEIGEPYVINKQFDRGECVLEFALCQPCHISVTDDMSEESKETTQKFFEENTDMDARSEELTDADPEDWIRHCIACGKIPNSKESFSLGGMVMDGGFVFDPYPLMVCGDCQSEVESRLSAQTKRRWDRFISDHFDGPPENAEAPPKRTPMLI